MWPRHRKRGSTSPPDRQSDQLIQAIFEYRLLRLRQRRALLIAELRPNDVRSWIECQLRAVMEQSEQPGSHYLSFTAMLWLLTRSS